MTKLFLAALALTQVMGVEITQPWGAQPYTAAPAPQMEPDYYMVDVHYAPPRTKHAVCSLRDPLGASGIAGTLSLDQADGEAVEISGQISGLRSGDISSLSVNELGTIDHGCSGAGASSDEVISAL